MILVDTSIWIGYFSQGLHQELDDLLRDDLIRTNQIILTELTPFLLHAKAFKAVEYLQFIDKQKLHIYWEGIQKLQLMNLKNGINKVGIPDLIIAQHALQYDLHIWSTDKHFKLMSNITALKLYNM